MLIESIIISFLPPPSPPPPRGTHSLFPPPHTHSSPLHKNTLGPHYKILSHLTSAISKGHRGVTRVLLSVSEVEKYRRIKVPQGHKTTPRQCLQLLVKCVFPGYERSFNTTLQASFPFSYLLSTYLPPEP